MVMIIFFIKKVNARLKLFFCHRRQPEISIQKNMLLKLRNKSFFSPRKKGREHSLNKNLRISGGFTRFVYYNTISIN